MRSSFSKIFRLGVFIVLGLCLSVHLWGQAAQGELRTLKPALNNLKLKIEKEIQKDTKKQNKGLPVILAQVTRVMGAVDKYLAGSFSKDSLAANVEGALTKLKEFPPKAKTAAMAAEEITKVQNVVRKLPDAPKKPKPQPPREPTPAPEAPETPTQTQDDLTVIQTPTVEEAAPTTPSSEDSNSNSSDAATQNTEKNKQSLIYILLGVYFIVLALLAYVLLNSVKKQRLLYEAKLKQVNDKLDDIEFVSGSGDTMSAVHINDLKKRIEALETNVFAFLQPIEERLVKLEKQPASSPTVSELQELTKRIERLEQASKPITPQNPEAATPVIIPPPLAPKPSTITGFNLDAAERLSALLADLHKRTRNGKLQNLCQNLIPNLKTAILKQSLHAIDGKSLAMLIQSAYVESLQTNMPGQYKGIVEHASQLGIITEDKMVGRMAFSEFYAENIPYADYPHLAVFSSPEFPDIQTVQKLISESEVMSEGVSNMVLFILKPTVMQQLEGVKSVLLKGIYIVS